VVSLPYDGQLRTYRLFVASVNLEGCAPTRSLPLMHIHGQADPTIPYLGTLLSPITGGPLPAVADSVLAWGLADRCTSAVTTTFNGGRTDVPIYSLNGCPAGTSVQLVRSKYMTHTSTQASGTQAAVPDRQPGEAVTSLIHHAAQPHDNAERQPPPIRGQF
jgi:poly(3-hydroxybutyrate) depolymerase